VEQFGVNNIFYIMNIDNFQELIDLTDYLDLTNEYLIRKFKEGGSYLIIDTYGDFLILKRDEVDTVTNIIWNDLYGPISEEIPHILN
jgi:hypothetical protein